MTNPNIWLRSFYEGLNAEYPYMAALNIYNENENDMIPVLNLTVADLAFIRDEEWTNVSIPEKISLWRSLQSVHDSFKFNRVERRIIDPSEKEEEDISDL